MFEKTRLRLTAWYLTIIMVVSFLFSFFIFTSIDRELQNFEQVDKIIKEHIKENRPIPGSLLRSYVNPDLIRDARARLITTLAIINTAIFVVAGGAGYFLAGRTLRPIKKMVDEQNRFITDASHELRTPLTSLRSEIEVNLRNKKLTTKDAKKILESNLEEVINLQALSDNLLELAQSENPKNTSYFTQVSIKECIDQAHKKLSGNIKKKNISVKKEIVDITINGISDRLIELLVILLDNAVKYSPEKSSITVSAKKKGEGVDIRVIDEGIGIHKEDVPHIFDRFYRTSKSRYKNNIGGYGLGLSIAKKIVKLHDGTITVESKVDKGTTFIVHLPIK